MPIELGRCSHTPREDRLFSNCGVLWDERHFIYNCPTIDQLEFLDILSLNEHDSHDDLQYIESTSSLFLALFLS